MKYQKRIFSKFDDRYKYRANMIIVTKVSFMIQLGVMVRKIQMFRFRDH